MSQKLSLDGDVLSLREAEDVGEEGEGCALVSTYTLVGVPLSGGARRSRALVRAGGYGLISPPQ